MPKEAGLPNSARHRRMVITVAYDGRQFDGWQSQPSGNTVQDHLNAAVRVICPAVPFVQGAGRTDAGVSANGQVAHFDIPEDWKMREADWVKAVNARLPDHIRVLKAQEHPSTFHAQFDAEGKEYRYRISVAPVLHPLQVGLAWHRPYLGAPRERLDAFGDALQGFIGTHDFRAFSANRHDGQDATRNAVRTIRSVEWLEAGEYLWEARITGDGFLYKMIRFLIGSAAWVAEGRWEKDSAAHLLRGGVDEKAPYCAPASGLTLERVIY